MANTLPRTDTFSPHSEGCMPEFADRAIDDRRIERMYGKRETGLQAPAGETLIEFTYRLTAGS